VQSFAERRGALTVHRATVRVATARRTALGQDYRLAPVHQLAGWVGRFGMGRVHVMNDPYEVLQVHRRADPDVIHAAYRVLARKYHPDSGGDVAKMTAITEAWAILGDPARRSAYDAQAARLHTRRAGDRKPAASVPAPAAPGGAAATRTGEGTVIDFGRYAGWTIGSLVNHDPEYLEWLARTPIGRRLTVEIREALARRESQMAGLRPTPRPLQDRRSIFRPWASAGAPAR
jgi:curved DNA-binding protein CbpA